mmetsp:Transcript_6304/g.19764  ORF Transcript_6304/g.19764 Transcript_6304/m.19764 type:complete len:216 (-) Transcript_6304:418-1065(-)
MGAQMATASSELMNSHTPSDAMMRKRSSRPSSCSITSGSAITPIDVTRWSPIDRAIASPGSVMFASSHTRAGPPHSSSGGETKPFFFLMRAISAGVSGFWSSERSSAMTPPDGERLASTARESPAFATKSFEPIITVTTAVVPDSSASMVGSCLSNESHCRYECLSACAGLSVRSGWSSRIACNVFIAKWLTLSPHTPCPSKTENIAISSESANG